MRGRCVLKILFVGVMISSPALAVQEAPDEAGALDPICPELAGFRITEAPAALPPGFVDCNDNSIPDECDIEWGTSFDCNDDIVPDECQVVQCEIEDGVHLISLSASHGITWYPERGFNTFNLYRGDLDLLKMTGLYTQDPAAVPLAARNCHLAATLLPDGIVPGAGKALYYILTGDIGPQEASLGTDSDGMVRINDNPCPAPPPLSVSVRSDKAVYAPGEQVQIAIDITNLNTADVIALQFPTTCQASFRIEDLTGSLIFSNPLTCFFIFTQLVLQPGQTATFTDSWSQIDDSGVPLALSGEFVVRGVLLDQIPEPSGITGISIQP